MMPTLPNCQSIEYPDLCTHQAAPRRLFGCAKCVLFDVPNDLRIKMTCRLQQEVIRPVKPPPKYP